MRWQNWPVTLAWVALPICRQTAVGPHQIFHGRDQFTMLQNWEGSEAQVSFEPTPTTISGFQRHSLTELCWATLQSKNSSRQRSTHSVLSVIYSSRFFGPVERLSPSPWLVGSGQSVMFGLLMLPLLGSSATQLRNSCSFYSRVVRVGAVGTAWLFDRHYGFVDWLIF